MIYITKFRANDLNPSKGKQIEFNSAVVSKFFGFTEEHHEIVFRCKSAIDSSVNRKIKASLSLSPSRGDYKIYQNEDGSPDLKDFFLSELQLTKENIDDCYAIKKGANAEYALYYIPKSTNLSDFLTEVAKDQFWFIPEKEIGNFNGDNTCTASSYRQYITAIKSKPFLLLAGISGTGKSRIVRELARSCWDKNSDEYKAQRHRNFEMIQVKPNWHDSSELFGYVSRINGETFVVGPFLKFMVRALKEPDVPYFLCLDEMNLAPVEQYFAEYLSVIESRKLKDDGSIETDPIVDFESTDAYHSLITQLFPKEDEEEDRRLFLSKEGGKRLSIPPNLIVVGTVNMDETTFSFSRKVLDRAMTIEMNEVDLWGGLTDRYESIERQSVETLVGTVVEGVDVYASYQAICDTCLTYLQKVNEVLEETPFKVAYRTRNEVLLYVVNNLPYNKSADGTTLSQEYVIARALDEITSMKILSRIEGDESKVRKDLLDRLVETIRVGLESILGRQYGAESMERDDSQIEKSISISKLKEMTKKLTDSGYTSYWS